MKNPIAPDIQPKGYLPTNNILNEGNINIQERIDDGILEIQGDAFFLQQYGITFPMLLKLARYYPIPEKKNFQRINLTSKFPIVTMHLQSHEFSELKVQLNMESMTIDNMSCMKNKRYKNTSGIVCKGFVQQVALAKELGFKYIYGLGGGSAKMKKQYKDKQQGYSYWFRLGFLHDEKEFPRDKEVQEVIKKAQNKTIRGCKSLNELLLLRDEDGERIGLQYREKYGFGVEMVFDLSSDSTSMKLLREHIANKQHEKPEKYSDLGV